MERHELDIAVQDLYTDLKEDGCNPLSIAASFMISAFIIYSSELSKKEYLEVMESIFARAGSFIEKRYTRIN